MNSKNLKIAQPYAEALLELTNKGSLDNLINDLNSIRNSLQSSKDLEKTLANPLVNTETKKNILKSIFSEKIENNTLRFLLVLCDRGRTSYIKPIVEKSLELAYQYARVETVGVTTAIPLSNTQQETLIARLKKMTNADQIKLEITVDPNLLGGFLLTIRSKIIDTTIRGQLQQLSSYLGASTLDFININ
jgi:F-type H+-transporting ATPase subunit delta